jgi:CBS domain containing-hemolysin-like protein
VFTRLGYLPSAGTKLEIPGLIITVRQAGRKRIQEVLLEKTTGRDVQERSDQTSAAA